MTEAHVGSGVDGSDLDFEVPEDADSVVCEYCDRPFPDEELLALHYGMAHDDITAEQRSAFEAAYEAEQSDLRTFKLKAAGAVVLVYFGFLMVYALV